MSRVVIDANYVGRGHFDVERLKGLAATLAGGDIDFVVPAVVVWEWAEHAVATVEALLEEHRRFPVDATLFPLPNMPAPVKPDDLIAAIVEGLPHGFGIWYPADTDWKAAVQAQVLQTGTGERKEGVKTGAADHIVLCCVRAQLEDRQTAEAVILATSDKHLRTVCQREFGDEVLYASNNRELLKRLIDFRPAASDLSESVEEQLSSRIKSYDSDIGTALATFSMGFDIASRREPRSGVRERARLGPIDIVELHDLEVGEFEAGARVGSAQIRIFADVDIDVMTLDPLGEDEFAWVPTWSGRASGGMIDLPLTVAFDLDWNITSVEPAGEATIDFDQGGDED